MKINFKLGEEKGNDVINMSRAQDWTFLVENFGRND